MKIGSICSYVTCTFMLEILWSLRKFTALVLTLQPMLYYESDWGVYIHNLIKLSGSNQMEHTSGLSSGCGNLHFLGYALIQISFQIPVQIS